MADVLDSRPYWTADNPKPRLTLDEREGYADEIRAMVAEFSLTYTWLIQQLAYGGLITDKFEMSSCLAGTRVGAKADEILRMSSEILHEYRSRNASCRE